MDRRGLIALALLSACAPRLPLVPTGPHRGEPDAVPYPPPPARVAIIPDPPNEDALWMDGTWIWTGSRYEWHEGRWMNPPPGAYYAPPSIVRRRNGELLYFRGTWYEPRATP